MNGSTIMLLLLALAGFFIASDLRRQHRDMDILISARTQTGDDLQALNVALEDARLADRTKSEFFANMSHELRTPLNAISGFSEMIYKEIFGPIGVARYREYAGDVNDSANHLLELINDILDYSKVEAGKAVLNEDNVDLSAIIKRSQRLTQTRAQEKSLAIVVDVPPNLLLLRADGRKIKQILINLLSNAIKFTPDGGRVSVLVMIDQKGALEIRVTDTGIGIAPEDIPKAMAPFQQIDSALNREHQGTGLGLPLCKSLVEMHGGELRLQSVLGSGTVVTVRLPPHRVLRDAPAQRLSA